MRSELRAVFREELEAVPTRRVHQDGGSPPAADDFRGGRLDRDLVGDVEMDEFRSSAALLDGGAGLRAARIVDVGDEYPGAGGAQPEGGGTSDARRRPGHHGDPLAHVLQAHRVDCSVSKANRLRS
jgi:hypothetical protein